MNPALLVSAIFSFVFLAAKIIRAIILRMAFEKYAGGKRIRGNFRKEESYRDFLAKDIDRFPARSRTARVLNFVAIASLLVAFAALMASPYYEKEHPWKNIFKFMHYGQ